MTVRDDRLESFQCSVEYYSPPAGERSFFCRQANTKTIEYRNTNTNKNTNTIKNRNTNTNAALNIIHQQRKSAPSFADKQLYTKTQIQTQMQIQIQIQMHR